MSDDTGTAGQTEKLTDYEEFARRIDSLVTETRARGDASEEIDDNHWFHGVADALEELKTRIGERPNYLRLTRPDGWEDDPEEWRRQAFERELEWRQGVHALDQDRNARSSAIRSATEIAYHTNMTVAEREFETRRIAESFYRWTNTGEW